MLIVALRTAADRLYVANLDANLAARQKSDYFIISYDTQYVVLHINDGNILRFSYPRRQTHIIGQVRRHYQDYAHSSRLFLARQLQWRFARRSDRALSITQEKNSFVPSVVHIPTMIGNTWLNGLCNEVYILSTGVDAFHYFCTWRDYCVAVNRFALDAYYCDSRCRVPSGACYFVHGATGLVAN